MSVVKYSQFDINKFKVGSLSDDLTYLYANIEYNYGTNKNPNYKNFQMQLSKIRLEYGGIPREGPDYPDVISRSHFKFSFCHEIRQFHDVNYEAIEKCYNVLKTIDEHCESEEFKKQLFGKNASKYAYQPIIEEQKQELNYIDLQPPLAKIKLSLNYSQDDIITFNFKISDLNRQIINIQSFDDVVQLLGFNSNLRFIVGFSIYAMKTKSPNGEKKYGIILKAIQIETDVNI